MAEKKVRKIEPRYAFLLRYPKDVEDALKKIEKSQNIDVRNDVINLSILKVAKDNINIKSE